MNSKTQFLFAFLASVVSLAAFSGASAQADTLLIQETVGRHRFKDAQFRLDATQGRAWVQTHYVELVSGPGNHGGHFRHYYHPTAVPGLWFDTSSQRILFNNQAGQKVVCANVTEKNGVFGRKWIITLTGECRTFAIRKARKTSVYFESK